MFTISKSGGGNTDLVGWEGGGFSGFGSDKPHPACKEVNANLQKQTGKLTSPKIIHMNEKCVSVSFQGDYCREV